MSLAKGRKDVKVVLTTEHANGYEEELLVERGPNHPAGPGYTAITSFTPKNKKKKK